MSKWLLLIGLLLWGVCSAPLLWAGGESNAITIIYSGNLDGELEPCGCSVEGDLGGIQRRATMIRQLRSRWPELFLISSGGLLDSDSANDRLKGQYILSGMATLGYDALGLQWSDLAYGPEFLAASPLPWTASNWLKDQGIIRSRQVTRGGVTMNFFAWLDPARSPFLQMSQEHQVVSDEVEALLQGLHQAKQRGELTVLSTSMSLKKLQRTFSFEGIDILLIRSAYEEYGEPQRIGDTLVLQPGSRGMRLGRVDLQRDSSGTITHWQHQVIPLPSSVTNDPSLTAWYDDYNAKVKEAYLASVELKRQQESGESPYAGAQACQSCHHDAYERWHATLHADAFARLQEVNKAFDPACIICHTVGFEKDGGYVDYVSTPQLANVQCESCHGAARAHVASQGTTPVANSGWSQAQICGQCHNRAHSPSFSLDTYWPRISH